MKIDMIGITKALAEFVGERIARKRQIGILLNRSDHKWRTL